MSIRKQLFTTAPNGQPIDAYTLRNANGLEVTFITYGATLISCKTPDRDGQPGEITLGLATPEAWLENPCYLGSTVGRCANRIAAGRFELDGQRYQLACNENDLHHLHGGDMGFDSVIWTAEPFETDHAAGVIFTYRSVDGEDDYPGTLDVKVTCQLTDNDQLRIDYHAVTDAPTLCNLTNHTYWNLAGHTSGEILDHVLQLHADHYTPVDENLTPTGQIAPVAGTPFDFRQPKPIGRDMTPLGGYDHNFALNDGVGQMGPAARVVDPTSGRTMDIQTTHPGIQLYTGNFLDGSFAGRDGARYKKHHGFCLETQHYPDAVHYDAFPSIVLRPGETYTHTTTHRFAAEA